MNKKKEFIYLRQHEHYKQYKVIKLGRTSDIVNRNSTYLTGEYIPGKFILVLQILNNTSLYVEKQLFKKFKHLKQYKEGGGIEFFNEKIEYELEPYLKENNILYHKLSEEEINDLERKSRIKVKKHNRLLYDKFILREFQNSCISIFKSKVKYCDSYNGLLIAPTGWGKSFINKCFMNIFLSEKTEGDILFITKRLDLLNDFISGLENDIQNINYSRLGNINTSKLNFNIINIFDGEKETPYLDSEKRNIYVINIDKLKNFDLENKIKDLNIQLCLIDEVQWVSGEITKMYFQIINRDIKYTIGCSATPMRDDFKKQQSFIKLFKKDDVGEKDKYCSEDLEIMFQLSYQECWDKGIILQPSIQYFKMDMLYDTSDKTSGWILSEKSYLDYLNQINDLWQNLVYHKAIMYFPKKAELIKFLIWCQYNNDIPIIRDCLDRIYFSFSKIYDYKENKEDCKKCNDDKLTNDTRCSDCMVAKLYQKLKEGDTTQFHYLDKDLNDFKIQKGNSLLLVVDRAKEGFDDKRVEMAINMNFVKSRCLLQTLQIIGRVQRIDNDKKKKDVYYVNPVPDIDNCHEMIIKGLADYIIAVFKDKDSEEGNSCIKKFINDKCNVKIGTGILKCKEDIYHMVMRQIYVNNDKKYWKLKYQEMKDRNKNYNFTCKIDFFKELVNYPTELNINNPDDVFKDKYNLWEGWYIFLNIDTSGLIRTLEEWKSFCKEKNIKNYEEYSDVISEYPQLPEYPQDLYPDFDNKDINYHLGFRGNRRR